MCDQTGNIKARHGGIAAGGYASEWPGGSKYFFQILRTSGFTKDGKTKGWTIMKLFKKEKPINIYAESLKNAMLEEKPLKPLKLEDEFKAEYMRIEMEIGRARFRGLVLPEVFELVDPAISGLTQDLKFMRQAYVWCCEMAHYGVKPVDIIRAICNAHSINTSRR